MLSFNQNIKKNKSLCRLFVNVQQLRDVDMTMGRS